MQLSTIKNPTFWRKRRSIFVKYPLIIVLFAILAKSCDSAATGYEKICLTAGCVHTASRVLKYMDPSVEPCNDFYRFSCGKFLENTVIPDEKTSVNVFSNEEEKFQQQLRASIEEEIKPNEKSHFRLVKNLYQNCMNQTAINKKGLKPALDVLQKLGGWPVLSGNFWNDANFDWEKSASMFRKHGYGFDYFFDFDVISYYKNSTQNVLAIDQTELMLPREYLIKGISDDIVSAYYEYMVDIAVIFGANKTRAKEELKESLEFEMKLANISLPIEETRNKTTLNNPMTVKELQTNFPTISWRDYFNAILSPNIEIGDDEVIIVAVPSFFKDFETIMAQTSKRTQANYVMWRLVAEMVSYLSEDVRKRELQFLTAVNGNKEREPRWQECIQLLSKNLEHSVGALYIRKYFDENSKKSAAEMVTEIRKKFSSILKNVNWMDQETRESALEKHKSMGSLVAYPDELLDDKKLEGYFENLEITSGEYIQSMLNLTFFNTDNLFNSLRKPVNKTAWSSHSTLDVFSTSYSLEENSILLPAGILQGTFFSHDRPRYMNYGAIGFVIGHEITHGFDDEGSQFDKEGNLVEWWQPETRDKYLSKAKCIIDQYANYTVKEIGMNVNGINTQGENIADNGGVKVAYLAYQEWVKRNGFEAKLPGLDYTPSQLFWISAAQVWCNKERSESLKLRIVTDPHSPEEFRVLGPLSNRPEFANDFKCSVGTRMNPKKKCSLW